MPAKPFPKLFSPLRVGSLTLKNRVAMAPIDTNLSDEFGGVTQPLLEFYRRRAEGGAGLIIVENTQVDFPRGKNTLLQLSADGDQTITGLSKLAGVIKQNGSAACLQLHHAGRETTLEVNGGLTPVAPSAIPCGHLQTPVRELTRAEIKDIIQRFINAAERGKAAGFDMIEIHGAHGYLVGQFLSPHTNKRSDHYGQGFQGRFAFAREIIAGIKDRLGKNFPLSFRFSADEFIRGGIDINLAIRLAQNLEQAGVDLINVSAGIYETLPTLLEPMPFAQGWRTGLAGAIKAKVKTPVACVGVIRKPDFAESLLTEGLADLIAIGRGLLADPDWPQKARAGRADQIRCCIGCNEGCLSRRLTKAISCSVNPQTGREGKTRPGPVKGRPRLVVIGAGPAGLEAACSASERGFEVIAFEEQTRIGGQLLAAHQPPGKGKIEWLLEYYRHRLARLDVDLRLGRRCETKDVVALKPDQVIVATGSLPRMPEFPKAGIPIFSADEVLTSNDKLAVKSVAIVGAGGIGCETALFLAKQGLNCHLFEATGQTAGDVEPITAWDLNERLAGTGIQIHLNRLVAGLEAGRLVFSKTAGTVDPSPSLPDESFGALIWSVGRISRTRLVRELNKLLPTDRVLAIGDAVAIGKIHDAVHSAARTVEGL